MKIYNWTKKNKIPIVIIFIIITALIFILVPIIINEAYKKNDGYITVWHGEDVLNYYGSAISAIGTIILGIIAWRQNTRLLNFEESNFMASNAASAILTEVNVREIRKTAINLETHEEQILQTRCFDNDSYFKTGGSISFTCKMKPLGKSQHIAMVNIEKMQLICSDEEKITTAFFSASNPNNQYTRVAISEMFDMFELTVLLSGEEKKKLIGILDSAYSTIMIDMTVSLLTDKYVATELKCRATLKNPDYDEKEELYTRFKVTNENPPTCFWNGTSLKNKQEIIIKSASGGQTNG